MRRYGRLAISLVVGCSPSVPTPAHCDGTCVADPAGHCILDPCRDDTECPSGLRCDPGAASATACARGAAISTCHWGPPSIDRLALINGFGVRTMALQVTPSPDLGFSWISPGNAMFVACGVFTCNPVVAKRQVHDDADDPVSSDTKLWQIANTEACLLQLYATDTSRSALPIDRREQQPAPAASCAADQTYDRVIDFVAAGCWTYDTSTIIAASELVAIPAAALASATHDIPGDAPCAHDGDACHDPAHDFFGACLAGTCQPRCTSAVDCELADAQLLGHTPDDLCRWDCRPVPTSLVGVCAPRTP